MEGDVFIGSQAQQYKGLFKINYPLEHGIVTDWDDMERIWQHVYTEGLKTVSEDVSKRYAIAAQADIQRGTLADSQLLYSTQYSSQNLH